MVRNAWNGIVRGRTAAIFGVIALGGSLAGCSGSDKPAKAAPPGTPGAAPSSASPPPSTHPFTGGRSGLKNPVLAVKIENTRNAMPQSGVAAADIVYIEQVEGGE